MTKMQLVLSQMINKAASGDARNLRIFLDVLGRFPPSQDTVRIDREYQEFLVQFIAAANGCFRQNSVGAELLNNPERE